MENHQNSAEQEAILAVLSTNQALSARLQAGVAAIVREIGSAYVDRVAVRCGRALSRAEFQRIVLQVTMSTRYVVESVRWEWAPEDVTIRSFSLIAHLTPNPP